MPSTSAPSPSSTASPSSSTPTTAPRASSRFDGLRGHEEYAARRALHLPHARPSEESIEENMETPRSTRAHGKINCFLEVEIGITGGEEDGVDKPTSPRRTSTPSPRRSTRCTPSSTRLPCRPAAALRQRARRVLPRQRSHPFHPRRRAEVHEGRGLDTDKPVNFVFHGGSGSSREDIREAIGYGVMKMNIDTDTQWSMWDAPGTPRSAWPTSRARSATPRPREAQQEVLRSPHVDPRRRGVHRRLLLEAPGPHRCSSPSMIALRMMD